MACIDQYGNDDITNELGKKVSFKIRDGGISVWTKFLSKDLKDVSEKGLIISDGKKYDPGNDKLNANKLGFASLNFAEQEKAVIILKDVL